MDWIEPKSYRIVFSGDANSLEIRVPWQNRSDGLDPQRVVAHPESVTGRSGVHEIGLVRIKEEYETAVRAANFLDSFNVVLYWLRVRPKAHLPGNRLQKGVVCSKGLQGQEYSGGCESLVSF